MLSASPSALRPWLNNQCWFLSCIVLPCDRSEISTNYIVWEPTVHFKNIQNHILNHIQMFKGDLLNWVLLPSSGLMIVKNLKYCLAALNAYLVTIYVVFNVLYHKNINTNLFIQWNEEVCGLKRPSSISETADFYFFIYMIELKKERRLIQQDFEALNLMNESTGIEKPKPDVCQTSCRSALKSCPVNLLTFNCWILKIYIKPHFLVFHLDFNALIPDHFLGQIRRSSQSRQIFFNPSLLQLQRHMIIYWAKPGTEFLVRLPSFQGHPQILHSFRSCIWRTPISTQCHKLALLLQLLYRVLQVSRKLHLSDLQPVELKAGPWQGISELLRHHWYLPRLQGREPAAGGSGWPDAWHCIRQKICSVPPEPIYILWDQSASSGSWVDTILEV